MIGEDSVGAVGGCFKKGSFSVLISMMKGGGEKSNWRGRGIVKELSL